MNPIITLTTDFGADSPYVAQMKAVLLSRCPAATLVDITHSVPPQNIRVGAVTLADCCFHFPAESIHIAVVDPGVGSDRKIALASIGSQRFVAPDNGLLAQIARTKGLTAAVHADTTRFPHASSTFHGRDIMAPLAAEWMLGAPLESLGEAFEQLQDTPIRDADAPMRSKEGCSGEIESVDHFGNLISNIPSEWIPPTANKLEFFCAASKIDRFGAHYAEHAPGELIALIGSHGRVEFAVVNGSAAESLGVGLGAKVRVRWSEAP